MIRHPPSSPLFPYTPLFRSRSGWSAWRDTIPHGVYSGICPSPAGTRLSARTEELGMDMDRETMASRSEEHTSELQSQSNLVCRLLLEKKKKLDCADSMSTSS